jgi:hypothetical protein
MDLVETLRSRIDALPAGDYSPGLRAILQHVRTATNHLARGQKAGDETAFTDAIYRTNQAFEGSLKEAYRVLAGKDPSTTTPFHIENYLQDNHVLRLRVLAQVGAYRQDWRNPSTHDHRLDFDEDEALLAIVSICALAIVLVDQIAERLRFNEARANVRVPVSTSVSTPLVEQVASALEQFRFEPNETSAPPRTVEVVGAVAGYLSAALPMAKVQANDFSGPRPLVPTSSLRVVKPRCSSK